MLKLFLNRNLFFTFLLITLCSLHSIHGQKPLSGLEIIRSKRANYAGMFDTGKKSGSSPERDCTCEKGEKGEKGEPGERGEKGERGPGGPAGERGERGIQGVRGRPGLRGEKGDKGDRGTPGEKGEKGEQGSSGEKGEKGDKGDKGEQGPPGEKGEKGEQGPPGEKGEKGDNGDRGRPGEKGEKGDRGESGPRGERGYRGFPGVNGARGMRGPRGEKGEKGDPGVTDKMIESITGSIKDNYNSMRSNSDRIKLLQKETWENSLDIKLLKNARDKNQDETRRNRVTSEKNSRKIFGIEGKNKVRDRNIRNNKERFIIQAKNFKSMHVEAASDLKTGAFVLRSMTFMGSELLNLDVTGIGIVFVKNAKSVRGLSKGVNGQVLYLFNTGNSVLVLESDFPPALQKIKLTSKKLELLRDEGVTLICDGKVWRILGISGRQLP